MDFDIHKAYQLERIWGKTILYLNFIFIRIKKNSPLPPAPFIVCANHGSYIDILTFVAVIKPTMLFIGKKEIENWPIVGIFFKNMNILIDRNNTENAKKSLEVAMKRLDEGLCIAIYPEGKIPDTTPQMSEFKNGAFIMAIDRKVPIVPITFKDNWNIFSSKGNLFSHSRPGFSRTYIHPYIDTSHMTELDLMDLKQKTFDTINQNI